MDRTRELFRAAVACLPLWDALKMLLRKCSKEDKVAAETQRAETGDQHDEKEIL